MQPFLLYNERMNCMARWFRRRTQQDKSVENQAAEKRQDQAKIEKHNKEGKQPGEETKEAVFDKTPEKEEPAPRGLFARLRSGLSRTRAGMSDRISALVGRRRAISEELFEELEEVLIEADVGVPTTLRIVDNVRERFQ